MADRPIVKVIEGGGESPVSGESVVRELVEVLDRRLPDTAPNDPLGHHLHDLRLLLGARLPGPRLVRRA